MNEIERVLDRLRRSSAAGQAAVLATVVRVEGSTYRRPGARMAFSGTDEPEGLISGGCLEADLAERVAGIVAGGEADVVVYDMRSPDDLVWGLGLGCDGEVRVLLEPVLPGGRPPYLEFLERRMRRREPGVLATVFQATPGAPARTGDRVAVDESGVALSELGDGELRQRIVDDARRVLERRRSEVHDYACGSERVEALVEFVDPGVALIVFGAGSDAVPVVSFAADLGWRVTVVDDREGHARAARFPGAAEVLRVDFDRLDALASRIDAATPVLVMTHHFLRDLELLCFLLGTAAPYVGLLGPRKRAETLLAELRSRGGRPTADQLARVHGPVGLDIGSETPEEIAVSALAEIQAVLTGRSGGFLRERRGPLHDAP